MRGFVIPTRLAFLACLIGLPWLVGACKATTDFGTDCTLVKKNPDGGSIAVAIREGELPDGGKDFISFGAAVCENFVCVRDSAYPKNPNPAAEAMGYCSGSCVAGTACAAANSADDRDPARKLTCRPLLLDELTIAAICTADPIKCQTYFGGNRSPYFCARGP
ncbi:MAG TPA: adventurous gliding motility lipoprotein CglC [Myxococcales bacterium]